MKCCHCNKNKHNYITLNLAQLSSQSILNQILRNHSHYFCGRTTVERWQINVEKDNILRIKFNTSNRISVLTNSRAYLLVPRQICHFLRANLHMEHKHHPFETKNFSIRKTVVFSLKQRWPPSVVSLGSCIHIEVCVSHIWSLRLSSINYFRVS